jgi:apoptosis-inducing factor 3
MSEPTEPTGPDLTRGIPAGELRDGAMLLGHAAGEAVLLVRRGEAAFAIGALCTHYGGPLAEGLLVGDSVRCPWHHACFDLRTGDASCAPALNPVSRWRVEQRDGQWFVGERLPAATPSSRADGPGSIVIIGGGAAGNAAAEMLRREGHSGRITMLSADDSVPYDRPNLSKNYLAGNAPEDWIPLRSEDFYREQRIGLRVNTRVQSIDCAARQLQLADGSREDYKRLLIATGAEPVRLDVPGAGLPHVHCLRTLADCRALIGTAAQARKAVVIGAGFIGMEAASALRARGIDVRIVAPGAVPMDKQLGPELGGFLRQWHEQHGVVFHLQNAVTAIDEKSVTLRSGERVEADLVLVGIGVRPLTVLAEQAGIAVDKGITVDETLQTSVPGIYAAGDIARWPDRLSGERIRVEHWVVAERQGQVAARNLLGAAEPFAVVPFFWTEQHGLGLSYVGHAERWDRIELDGRLESQDCMLSYWLGSRRLAVVTIGRDAEGLRAELEMERSMAA